MRTMTSPRRRSTETRRGARAGTREDFALTMVNDGRRAAVTMPRLCPQMWIFHSYFDVNGETSAAAFRGCQKVVTKFPGNCYESLRYRLSKSAPTLEDRLRIRASPQRSRNRVGGPPTAIPLENGIELLGSNELVANRGLKSRTKGCLLRVRCSVSIDLRWLQIGSVLEPQLS